MSVVQFRPWAPFLESLPVGFRPRACAAFARCLQARLDLAGEGCKVGETRSRGRSSQSRRAAATITAGAPGTLGPNYLHSRRLSGGATHQRAIQ